MANENQNIGDSPVRVTRGLGDAQVLVLPGQTIVHEGAEYGDGDKLVIDMPLAQNLALGGHVEILGAA